MNGRPGPAILPVIMMIAGGYLMWFAVHYWRGAGPAVWPSYPIKSVLQGHGIPPNTGAATAEAQLTAYEAAAGQAQGQGGGQGGQGGGVPQGSEGQPQNIAKLLLGQMGWSGQFGSLNNLWTRESGWNPRIANQSSGALGIAQALGHGGSDTGGTLGNEYGAQYGLTVDQARQANSGNALQQIRWGLGYIRDRYGSVTAAWAHEEGFGWY